MKQLSAQINNKIKKILMCSVFLSILFILFLNCTYLFRNTSRNARQNILGFYEEEKNSLEVIFVGSSSVYRFCDPMILWNKYGITSYDYSVSTMSSATTIAAIDDIMKRQSPKLIVIELRGFLSNRTKDEDISSSVRNVLDSQDITYDRFKAVRYYKNMYDIPWSDIASEYIEIIQYHNNKEALGNELNWRLADNRVNEDIDKDDFFKGFAVAGKWKPIDKPYDYMTEERKTLSERSEKILRDSLDYCKNKNIEVLLTVSPYSLSKEAMMEYNTMEDIAKEYNVPVLNANKYLDEMELDFSKDYYDNGHVNIYGAEKYMILLGKYLSESYKFTDYRKDTKFNKWNDCYERYCKSVNDSKNYMIKID